MNNTLQGRRALVTGSLQGIGHAVALALAQQGCKIVLHGLGPQALQDSARQTMLAAGAPSAVVYTHDLSDPAEIAKLMKAVLADGPLDILVNNAGIQHVAPLAEMPDAMWDKIIAVGTQTMQPDHGGSGIRRGFNFDRGERMGSSVRVGGRHDIFFASQQRGLMHNRGLQWNESRVSMIRRYRPGCCVPSFRRSGNEANNQDRTDDVAGKRLAGSVCYQD